MKERSDFCTLHTEFTGGARGLQKGLPTEAKVEPRHHRRRPGQGTAAPARRSRRWPCQSRRCDPSECSTEQGGRRTCQTPENGARLRGTAAEEQKAEAYLIHGEGDTWFTHRKGVGSSGLLKIQHRQD